MLSTLGITLATEAYGPIAERNVVARPQIEVKVAAPSIDSLREFLSKN
jgi:hypothetical protein